MEKLPADDLFRRGIHLFNAGEFYECHEVLEDLWRPMQGSHRLFVQAVIHFAVAFYHCQRHNPQGAERQLRKGLHKLAGYLPAFEGINTAELYRQGEQCLEQIRRGRAVERFPVIESIAK